MVQKSFLAVNKLLLRMIAWSVVIGINSFALMSLGGSMMYLFYGTLSPIRYLVAAIALIVVACLIFILVLPEFVILSGNTILCVVVSALLIVSEYFPQLWPYATVLLLMIPLCLLNIKLGDFCFPVVNLCAFTAYGSRNNLIYSLLLPKSNSDGYISLNEWAICAVIFFAVAVIGFLLTKKFHDYTMAVKCRVEDDNFVFKAKGKVQHVKIVGDIPVKDKVIVNFKPDNYDSYVVGFNPELLLCIAVVGIAAILSLIFTR